MKYHGNDVQLKSETIMKNINSVGMVVVATVLLAFVTSCNGTTDEKQGRSNEHVGRYHE